MTTKGFFLSLCEFFFFLHVCLCRCTQSTSACGKKLATEHTQSCGVSALHCAVVTNRGWDTNAILGHVDPHLVTESACAGSHTQVIPTNLCGWYFLSSGV